MKQGTKLLILFLSLICLIIVCVYTHVDTIKIKNQKIERNSLNTSSKNEDIKGELIENKVFKSSNKKDGNYIKKSEEKILNEIGFEQIAKNDKEDLVLIKPKEENKQEILPKVKEEEPLIRTNPKYIREGEDRKIENLSRKSQSLQLEINDLTKNNPILFKRASYKVTKKSNKTIMKIVKILKDNPNLIIEIAGHTDAAGAKSVNEAVSLGRAKSVLKLLFSLGIDKKRLKARGYGPDIPLVKNSPNGYSIINRRVEFNIIGE